jgi:hypothetical protein
MPLDREKRKQYLKQFYLKNREKRLQYNKEWRLKNRERRLQYKKEWYLNNKNYCKEWHINNRERRLQYNKEYNLKNKEKRKQWRLNNKEKSKKYQNKYYKKKIKIDPNYKLIKNMRTRIWFALKRKYKSKSTIKLLGCSVKECWQHLKSKFQPGMTKENYGQWHVDHIIPCASFDLKCPVQQMACFHYTNLQPLWAADNIRKKDKICLRKLINITTSMLQDPRPMDHGPTMSMALNYQVLRLSYHGPRTRLS